MLLFNLMVVLMFKRVPNKTYTAILEVTFVNTYATSKTLTVTAKNSEEAYRELCVKVYSMFDSHRFVLFNKKMYAVKHILSWNLYNVTETK